MRSELFSEVSLSSGELALGPESGGSRQPLRRQVRYYSERAHVASRDLGTSVAPSHKRVLAERKGAKMPKAPLPMGWRLGTCGGHWPLGTSSAGLARLRCSYPAGFP